MIVSASINADIPANHGAWFMRRLDAGYCRTVRSDGLGDPRVLLTSEAVDGFVFWTRCVDPFLPVLDRLHKDDFTFTLQFAITGYPQGLDPAPVSMEAAAAQLVRLAGMFGPRVAVWRYDPLRVTPATPLEWHPGNFERIARLLAGATDEVVLAFMRNEHESLRKSINITAADELESSQKRNLVKLLAQIADNYGMRLTLCAQPDWLAPGAAPARCISVQRLTDVSGRSLAVNTKGFLPGCLCAEAVDIGDSNISDARFFCGALPPIGQRNHDPNAEFLFPPSQRFQRAQGADLPF